MLEFDTDVEIRPFKDDVGVSTDLEMKVSKKVVTPTLSLKARISTSVLM